MSVAAMNTSTRAKSTKRPLRYVAAATASKMIERMAAFSSIGIREQGTDRV
jgi:hypothetical protein